MSPYEFDPDTNMNPINPDTQAFQQGQAAAADLAASQAQAQATQPPPATQAPNSGWTYPDLTNMTSMQRERWLFDAICAFGRTCEQNTTFQQTTTQALQQLMSSKEPKVTLPREKEPRKFNGKADQVVPWVREVRAAVELHKKAFTSEYQKCLWASSYLADGMPISWYNVLDIHKDLPGSPLQDWDRFLGEFKRRFESPSLILQKTREIERIKQTGSCATYTALFGEILVYLDLSEETKIHYFKRGLKSDVLKALAPIVNKPTVLESYADLATTVDNELWAADFDHREQKKSQGRSSHTNSWNSAPVVSTSTAPASAPVPSISASNNVIPMEVDTIHRGPLSPQEKQHRRDLGLCLYCGKGKHLATNCPNKSFKAQRASKAAPSAGKA